MKRIQWWLLAPIIAVIAVACTGPNGEVSYGWLLTIVPLLAAIIVGSQPGNSGAYCFLVFCQPL